MATFYIRSKDKKGTTKLYARVCRRTPPIDFRIETGIEVSIINWQKANIDANKWIAYSKTAEGQKVTKLIDLINDWLEQYFINFEKVDKNEIKQAIFDIVGHDANKLTHEADEARKEKEEAEARRLDALEAKKRANVMLYLDERLKGMREGTVKSKGGRSYQPSTIAAWESFQKILKSYYKAYPFEWEDVNPSLIHSFISFLEKGKHSSNSNTKKKGKKAIGVMDNTINKQLAIFCSLVQFAMKDGLHNNEKAKGYFKENKRKVSSEDKVTEIYLSADELDALYKMPLIGERAKIRDIFLVGCYTCQRVSDYSRLTRENFTTTAKGTPVVRIRQVKTGNEIVIPILNDNLIAVMERNNWDLSVPVKYKRKGRVHNKRTDVLSVTLNEQIKDILKELSEKVTTLAHMEKTQLTMKEKQVLQRGDVKYQQDRFGNVLKPRYDLVSSHTARRSGITNLYLTGKFDTKQMMSISGHKDERTFLSYIKLSSDEVADLIAMKAKEDSKVVNMF